MMKAHKKTFVFLWILSIIGTWSIIPYIRYLDIFPASISNLRLFLLITFQSAAGFALICYLSYKILPKTDLQPFRRTNFLYPALLFGLLTGLTLFILDKVVFHSSLLTAAHPPFWAGALASIYGAVNEEVSLRLFLFTALYFLFKKCFKFNANKQIYFLWATNILVSLIFGLGHLPAALKLTSPTAFEITRVLLLNGIAGIVFGWLYWSRGLWAAMGAHFVADLMLHAFLIL